MARDLQFEMILELDNKVSKGLANVGKDIKRLDKTHKRSSREMQKNNKGLRASFKQLGGIIAGAFVVREVTRFGKELFRTATELDLLEKKASTVLGEFKDEVEDTANEVAASMGLTRSEFVKASTDIADLLIPMQFTREEASGMSTDLVELSGALAEWSGGQRSASEVTKILGKAMLGEREQLKELGIAISEFDVQQRLLENGQKDLTGTALQQAKAQATVELIYEKSTDAQAAFKEGGDSLIRSQAEIRATLNETKETMAQALMPTFQEVTGEVLENVNAIMKDKDTMDDLAATMEGLGEVIIFVTDGVIGFTTAIGDAMGWVANLITDIDQALLRSEELLGIRNSSVANRNFLTPEAQARADELGINYGGARAKGGNVMGNTAYLVGEKGPELFVPRGGGAITPNNQVNPSVEITFGTVNINNGMDVKNFGDMVQEKVYESLKGFRSGVAA